MALAQKKWHVALDHGAPAAEAMLSHGGIDGFAQRLCDRSRAASMALLPEPDNRQDGGGAVYRSALRRCPEAGAAWFAGGTRATILTFYRASSPSDQSSKSAWGSANASSVGSEGTCFLMMLMKLLLIQSLNADRMKKRQRKSLVKGREQNSPLKIVSSSMTVFPCRGRRKEVRSRSAIKMWCLSCMSEIAPIAQSRAL
jgi:hypothetical protein